jgi:hypothetical protein
VNEVASCDKGKSERECTRDMLVKVVPADDDDVTHFDVQQIGRSKMPKVEGAIWPNIDATFLRRTTIKVVFGFCFTCNVKLVRSTQPTLSLE